MKKRDHAKLICDIGELSGLFSDAPSLETFLQKIVEMISEHMQSQVCSIYLFYEDTQELVLKATKGLNPDAVGTVKLKLGEGLTGLAVQQLRPICERHASKNPGYRYFSEIGEEPYESFLAVPILRGQHCIGAMVVQNSKKNYFTQGDIKVLRAITSQLATTIETAKLLMGLKEGQSLKDTAKEEKALKLIKGRVASEGIVLAEAAVWGNRHFSPLLEGAAQNVRGTDRRYTLEDFHRAVQLTEKQLEDLQKQIEEKLADVASLIFTAQILMLKDGAFTGMIVGAIESGTNPPRAVREAVETYIRRFEGLSNLYLQEKKQDVQDMGRRLLGNMVGLPDEITGFDHRIVIAQELLPSDILKLFSQKVKGVILLSGGITSHLSILARSLGMPLVITGENRLLQLPEKTTILLDAEQGNIHINPSSEITRAYHRKEEDRKKVDLIKSEVRETTNTKDGQRVKLLSNINLLGDLEAAKAVQSEGIGLYRTEFPFIIRSDFPSEEEQYVVYRKLVEAMPQKEITFRTLDIGGDKVLSYYDYGKEENPFLGMRSIRFSLRHQEIFASQLKAILRAGVDADLRIMFPMISSLDDFFETKRIVASCVNQLKEEKVPHHRHPQLGVMIELPAVLEIIHELAHEADFFSIGTNDFIQYMLAVDRTNEKVADFYLPHHPSIFRALKKVVEAAQRASIEVSVCGDMAHNERYVPHLLGLGIRRFSVDARYLPRIQKVIEATDLRRAEKKVEQLLKEASLSGIDKVMGAK